MGTRLERRMAKVKRRKEAQAVDLDLGDGGESASDPESKAVDVPKEPAEPKKPVVDSPETCTDTVPEEAGGSAVAVADPRTKTRKRRAPAAKTDVPALAGPSEPASAAPKSKVPSAGDARDPFWFITRNR